MDRPPVRTITLGVAEPHPLPESVVMAAAAATESARAVFESEGYQVQTVRLSTRPMLEDLSDWPDRAVVAYGRRLQALLDRAGIAFCSLGPAPAAEPDFPVGRLDAVADLLADAPALSCAALLATADHGPRYLVARAIARVMLRLAAETTEGLGNFRFAMLARVPPGGAFFPAAYHRGPAALTVGLQAAATVREALHDLRSPDLDTIADRVRVALVGSATPVVELAQTVARDAGLAFGGIDLSPAPAGEDSIAAAFERFGWAFGDVGTLAVAGAITLGIRSTELPVCGYNGLMLPVLEDERLAARWADGMVDVQRLLACSAVCGTGLDTLPLSGEHTDEEIGRLLMDVAVLAVRAGKPLSARLFPCPGTRPGDHTSFNSPYLVNSVVR